MTAQPLRRHVTGAQEMTIQSLARQMLDEAGGDIVKALDKLDNYASNIKRFNDEFRRFGCNTLLNSLASTTRAAMKTEAKAPFVESAGATATRARMLRAGAAIRSALMEMPYQIGGIVKPLRKWTGDVVQAHGEDQLATALSSARNAHFLIAVGKAAGKKPVGDLGDKVVEKLHREAMESG